MTVVGVYLRVFRSIRCLEVAYMEVVVRVGGT